MRTASQLAFVALFSSAACGPSPAATTDADHPIPAPQARPADPAPLPVATACQPVDCAAPSPLPALSSRIRVREQDVLDSSFREPLLIVDLGRLQLLRSDPDHDLREMGRNAQRAVAVDPNLAEGHLLAAMTMTRTWLGDRRSRSPLVHHLRVRFIELQAARAAELARDPFVQSGALTLLGYCALELGEGDRASDELGKATQLDPSNATAWLGRAQASYANGQPKSALPAYERALSLRPGDPLILGYLAQFQAELPLALNRPVDPPAELRLDPQGLRVPPLVWPACRDIPPHPTRQAYCDALDAVEWARTPEEHEAVAHAIVDAYSDIKTDCTDDAPECTEHVATMLAGAALEFHKAGRLAKSIQIARALVQAAEELPGASSAMPHATLLAANGYYSVGIVDQAAELYELHAEHASNDGEPARRRAIALRALLADDPSKLPDTHQGAGDDAEPSCHQLLFCAARQLAGEGGWNELIQ